MAGYVVTAINPQDVTGVDSRLLVCQFLLSTDDLHGLEPGNPARTLLQLDVFLDMLADPERASDVRDVVESVVQQVLMSTGDGHAVGTLEVRG